MKEFLQTVAGIGILALIVWWMVANDVTILFF